METDNIEKVPSPIYQYSFQKIPWQTNLSFRWICEGEKLSSATLSRFAFAVVENFEADSFDVVVANFVVHHLARPERVFREVHRVLKPSGHFAFVVWGAAEEQSSIGAFFGAVEAHLDIGELPHGPLFGVTERSVYEPMITKAGLEACQLTVHEVTWRTDSLAPVLQGFWDWGNMDALPSEIQEKIKETTRENAQTYEQDGRFAFPHSVLLGSARKA